jgi:hypothetical protein
MSLSCTSASPNVEEQYSNMQRYIALRMSGEVLWWSYSLHHQFGLIADHEVKFQIIPSLFTTQHYCWNILWIITPAFYSVPVYIPHQLHWQDYARACSAATAMCCFAMWALTPQVQVAIFLFATMEVSLMRLLKLCKQNVAIVFFVYHCLSSFCSIKIFSSWLTLQAEMPN